MFFFFSGTQMSLDSSVSFATTSSASSSMTLMTDWSDLRKSPPTVTPTTFESVQKKKKIENQPTMSGFVMRTSTAEKHKIDKQIAKAIFATNSSFRCIETSEVKKAILY